MPGNSTDPTNNDDPFREVSKEEVVPLRTL